MVEDEDSENHLEEVEAEKSILQTSSSQLFYTRFVKMDHLNLMMSPLCVSFLK